MKEYIHEQAKEIEVFDRCDVLVVVCVIRELLGSGTFGGGILNGGEGIRIIPAPYPAMQMVMPVGGFLVLGCVIAASQWLVKHLEMKNKKKEAAK